MTTDKAIEVANKMQLSNNPLWVEVKRLGEMYDRREAELYSTNHELFDEGVEYLRKITDLEKKNAELEASLLDVSEKTVKQIKELEAQIEKMKLQYDYVFNQLCESREIICLMLSQYKNKKEIDYSTKERGKKLLKQRVYKYDK